MKTMIARMLVISACWVFVAPAFADPFEIVLQPSELLRQGNSYLEAGEIDKAKKVLARALNSDLTEKQMANVHNSMCVAHIKEEAWQTALKHCDAAIKIVPTNWRFHNNRGNIHFGMRNYQQAMENYQKGLKIAPKSQTIAANIEMLQRYLKRVKPAVALEPT